MLKIVKGALLLLSMGLSQVFAGLLETPEELWSESVGTLTSGIYKGNGVFLTPDGATAIAITDEGVLSAFDAESGSALWTYTPDAVGDSAVKSASGITFTTDNALTSYMVFAVTDKAEKAVDPDFCRVIALDLDGMEVAVSEQLAGEHSGTPVVSDNGAYIYLTHNSADNTIGHFTILSVDSNVTTTALSQSKDMPFAPVGIFHNPAEGFYDDVYDTLDPYLNTNDIVLWSATPAVSGQTVADGMIFGFQMVTGVAVEDLSFVEFGGSRGFRTITPPLITNQGRTAYFTASRSQLYGFAGEPNLLRAHFNRNPNLKITEGFETAQGWRGQPIFTVPVETTTADGEIAIYFGGAWKEFICVTYEIVDKEVSLNFTTTPTDSVIFADPVLDPEKRAIYFVESSGKLQSVEPDKEMTSNWSYMISTGVQGQVALSPDGKKLYLGSTSGEIIALKVAEDDATPSPTVPPTEKPPTPAPTPAPTSTAAAKSLLFAFVVMASSLLF